MPRKASLNLWNLIRVMNAEESYYFKQYAALYAGDSQYLKLFESIQGQETYDENLIKLNLYGSIEGHNNKFSVLKNYLYQLILSSLDAFHYQTSYHLKFKQLLIYAELLLSKGEAVSALSFLEEAYQLAIETEDDLGIASVQQLFYNKYLLFVEKHNAQSILSTFPSAALPLISNQYWLIFSEALQRLLQQAFLRSPEGKDWIEHFYQNDLLQKPPNTHNERILYEFVWSFYYYFKIDIATMYERSKTLLNLVESHSKQDSTFQITILSNLLVASMGLLKFDECLVFLEKLKNIPNKLPSRKFFVFKQYYTTLLMIHIKKGTFLAAEPIMKEMLGNEMSKHALYASNIDFFCAYVHIGLKQYEEAIGWINNIIDNDNQERQDMKSAARILSLLVHHELGNHLMLEQLVKNHYRFFKKRGRFLKFERAVLKFVRSAMRVYDEKSLKPLLIKLSKQLQSIAVKDPTESIMLEYFDFVTYLESKIKGKDFASLVQEKHLGTKS